MLWARLLAYVTGTVNQELLLRNEYLAAENRILRDQIRGRLLLSDGEKVTLAEIAHRLGRMVLEEVATAKPDTILGWYRKLIANKFDGSKLRRSVGRPKVDQETERLVLQMARENPSWATIGSGRCLGKSRPSSIGSDGGQRPPSPWHFSSAEKAKAIGLLEELYPLTPGRLGGNGLLAPRSPNAQRVDDLLRAVLHPLGNSPGESGRDSGRTQIRNG